MSPWRPARACLEPRCPELAVARGRCQAHAKARQAAYNAGREAWIKAFYRDTAWLRLRAAVVTGAACVDCGAPATDADHLVALRERPDLGLEPSNVVPRCHGCHSARTSREQSWNRRR